MWRNLRASFLKSRPTATFDMLMARDGVMSIASSLAPWPWPSRSSKEETTDVRILPTTVRLEVYKETGWENAGK